MIQQGGRAWPLLFALGLVAGAAGSVALLRRLDVVEVAGSSMAPGLLPGDRLLVESISYARRRPAAGEVVLARDPRSPARELIKRVADVQGSRLQLRGDAPEASTDSREFGAVAVDGVRWRAILRYWPPGRAGRLPGASG